VEPIAVEPTQPSPPPGPVIEPSPVAVTERARERFLTAARLEMRNLPPIPNSWPSGRYLSLPSEYPGVVDVWQSYLYTMRAVRARDVQRYGEAYESALDDAQIQGEPRTIRFNRALADFQARAIRRDAHYDRVEALALAAIQSHNALIEAEGLILFDELGLDGDPGALGVGTSTRDEESRVLLDDVLALLSKTLDADGMGPRHGANVRAWVEDGLLAAMTH
jgi:hypothetical protein